VAATGAGTNNLGTYSVDADGHWSYTVNNAAVQHLSAAETATDTFTVGSLDGTANQMVTVTIQGENDAASFSGDTTGLLTEDSASPATGTLVVSDVDDGEAHSVAATGAGTNNLGTYSVDADGHWSYTVNNAAVQHLSAAETATDTFTVGSLDGTANQTVTIDIVGTNDPAVFAGTDTGSVVEAGGVNNGTPGTPTVSATLTSTDIDGTNNLFLAESGSSSHGSWSMTAAGTWTFTLDNANAAVQALNVGNTLVDTFAVHAADGTAHNISVTTDGANDAAVISGTTSGSVTEATLTDPGIATANGTLTDTDVDNAANSFQGVTTATSSDNHYGSYTIDTSGHWTYTLDNTNPTVDALSNGQTLTDSFTVHTADGTSQAIGITINGQTDDLGGPTGLVFVPTQTGNQQTLGFFQETGDPDATDTFTYASTSTNGNFSVDASGNLITNLTSTTQTGDLIVTAYDHVHNQFSSTFHIMVGSNGNSGDTFTATSSNTIEGGFNGSDTLNVSSGIDYLLGGQQDDVLVGNGGADILMGGGGNDRFVYQAASDSTVAVHDTIMDFTTGHDVIDFSATTQGYASISSLLHVAVATSAPVNIAANTIEIVQATNGTTATVYANTTSASESLGSAQMEIQLTGVAGQISSTDIHHA
jgi:VCBS repeat-containing protein